MSRERAGFLLLLAALAGACAPGEPRLDGRVELADGVDPSMFETLELRVLEFHHEDEPQPAGG